MTRFDRVIPPGGRGKITLSIDSRRVSGPFNKRSVVWSDDPQKPSVALYLKGTVEHLILLEPGGYLGLWGAIGKTPPAQLKILNNNPRPLKITGIDSDLLGHIRWELKEIEAGNVYQLEVEDISPQAGEYSGHLFIRTDHPQKPELVIIIQGGIVEK